MLRSLSIRDFVIVDRLDLEFSAGFTVFSGETGAGKSILIDALALAMGERGDASMVRTGQTRADITAEFAADAEARPDLEAWLQAQALTLEEHGGVLLRRVLDSGGRSRAFINGTPATLAQLRELGEMLVDIHGQHAHQQLLRPDAQRRLTRLVAADGEAGVEVTSPCRVRLTAYRLDRLYRTHSHEIFDGVLEPGRHRIALDAKARKGESYVVARTAGSVLVEAMAR